jgi:hypothetical protein
MKVRVDDPARWPVSRFVREFMPSHWDGRVALASIAVNWPAALVCALTLVLLPASTSLAWVHVVAFTGMPVIGFAWFLRDVFGWRRPWQVPVNVIFQVVWAVFPWVILAQSIIKKAG